LESTTAFVIAIDDDWDSTLLAAGSRDCCTDALGTASNEDDFIF
jgi:hypothetical protein